MGMAEPNGFQDDAYIRTAQAAKILRVSPKTVSRWAKEGKLPHVITLGGHRRFPSAAIKDLASELKIV
jgi:excisionase family DNA binding protein